MAMGIVVDNCLNSAIVSFFCLIVSNLRLYMLELQYISSQFYLIYKTVRYLALNLCHWEVLARG